MNKTLHQPVFIVNAFADSNFKGNPAAVCPLENAEWLDDVTMQNIAMQHNLSETAFVIKKANGYHIRWFAPEVEIDLCGHATLATAFVLWTQCGENATTLSFESRSGILEVRKDKDMYWLNFPTDTPKAVSLEDKYKACFTVTPKEVFESRLFHLFVYENEKDIVDIGCNFDAIKKLGKQCAIITAKSNKVDFVDRVFCPQCGINEDPVTGSAYTCLTPYWSERLHKSEFHAIQVSARTGNVWCKLLSNNRTEIGGKAKLFSKGILFLD